MRTPLTILAALALLCSGPARADDDCLAPLGDWQPRQAVARLAAERGWQVRRIKIDDGCYEIRGTDRDGRRIEVTVQPDTLRVIEIEHDDRHPPRPESGRQDRRRDDDG